MKEFNANWLIIKNCFQVSYLTSGALVRAPCPIQASLTCTGAGCEAHPLPSSVKDHIEALHHGSTNHQRVCGRWNAESVTFIIQASPHHGLNVKLLKRKEQTRKNTSQATPPNCWGCRVLRLSKVPWELRRMERMLPALTSRSWDHVPGDKHYWSDRNMHTTSDCAQVHPSRRRLSVRPSVVYALNTYWALNKA